MFPCRVKICGITRIEDALLAAKLGAHAIGLIFAESPRKITPESAAEIIRLLPPLVTPVGVFVKETPESVRRICDQCGLRTVQLHGDEPPRHFEALSDLKTIKVIRVRDRSSFEGLEAYPASAFLLDTYSKKTKGGTGETFPWDLLEGVQFPKPFFLSGGLRPENVAEAIRRARPYGVDVSSGVESEPGRKDSALLRKLFDAIRAAGAQKRA